ncbi:MAG: hypothetical protein AB8B87_21210 [Granulosicoccus sp.]
MFTPVFRQQAYLFTILSALVIGTVYASESTTMHPWADDYYRDNTACTVATIESVDVTENQVTVMLDVESATADALNKSDPQQRNNWMALHCPPEIHRAWTQNPSDFDVLIIASLASMGQYAFSCASHHRFSQQRRNQRAAGVLDRLRQLLNSSYTRQSP